MLTRRNFVVSLSSLGVLSTTTNLANACPAPAAVDGDHQVLMLNAACNDTDMPNMFEPAILRIEEGDSVTYIASDAGHNSASKKGMIPEGAEPWNGGIDEELTVTFTVPGIYGYICVPHYEMGMVGLIVVGDDYTNLKQVKKIRHPGDARGAFRALFKQLESENA